MVLVVALRNGSVLLTAFQEVADIVMQELQAELAPELIVIYGSFTSGTYRSESDVDIAYLGGKTLSDYERFLLAQRLAGTLDRDVDLVDLAKASTVLQMQTMHKGTVVYCKDNGKRQNRCWYTGIKP